MQIKKLLKHNKVTKNLTKIKKKIWKNTIKHYKTKTMQLLNIKNEFKILINTIL